VEELFNELYHLYVSELLNLNLGHGFNQDKLWRMSDLVNAIEYIRQADPSNKEIMKILEYYEANLF
jgi:hypothetical protein